MVRQASTESQPKNFPFFPATRPKALTSGSANCCPMTPSRNSSGMPSNTSAIRNGIKNAPPPWRYALELKPRIFAKPTAEPIIDQIKPDSLCHMFCLSSPCIKYTFHSAPSIQFCFAKPLRVNGKLTFPTDFKAFSGYDNSLVVQHLEPLGVAAAFKAASCPLCDHCSGNS